jgi:hypothetical protein
MQSHNAEVGFRNERRLSPTRRMHFGASIGATYTENPALLEVNRENTSGTGGASFGIDLGRSWVLGADYRRGVQFYEGFARPFYYDRVNVNVAGYLSSRLRLTLSTGYDTGQVGFSEQRQYDTYLATAALQYALAQNVAITGSYGYYRYVYDRLVVLPAGIPQEFDRQTVSVGITFWVPVM